MIEGFFNKLQDKYNVNTVPTVVKLTNKLQKAINMPSSPYPFCPLCMGVRDEVNNLLEMGSTIKHISLNPDGSFAGVEAIKKSEDWLQGAEGFGRALCFGCKRMIISAYTPDKRQAFQHLLPKVVLQNCERLNIAE